MSTTSLSIASTGAKVVWQYDNVLAWDNATQSSSFSYNTGFDNGTALNQADRIYITQGTLAASTSANVDLAGSLLDIYGNTITFARIKVIYLELTTDTTASAMYIGGAASNGFANWISSAGTFATDQPKVSVRNGGVFYLCAPDATAYAVTAGTGDILKLTNADGANVATYKLVLAGASA